MKRYYSSGKLLLSGEYVVLDGANALAIPTAYGQSLTVTPTTEKQLFWTSLDDTGATWFTAKISFTDTSLLISETSDSEIAESLIKILTTAKSLNSKFLNKTQGYKVVTTLEFPRNWGLGSSSTLLNNVAQWADVNPFKLSEASFGGSGYDIACASSKTPLIYKLTKDNRFINPIKFNKDFESKLFFIHLNEKQNSRDGITMYQNNKANLKETITEINSITDALYKTQSLEAFKTLLTKHELLIGKITKQTPIQQRLFSDYKHAVKSLGAWGGDFILATGERAYVASYFKNKGYTTIIPYKDMILSS